MGMDLIDQNLLKRLEDWHRRLCKIPAISSKDVPRSFSSCFAHLVDETDAQVMNLEARALMNDWIEMHSSYTADASKVAAQSQDNSSSLPVSGEAESGC